MSRVDRLDDAGEHFFNSWKHMIQGFNDTGRAVLGIES